MSITRTLGCLNSVARAAASSRGWRAGGCADVPGSNNHKHSAGKKRFIDRNFSERGMVAARAAARMLDI
jgi:hypothetical protein